MGLFSGDFYSEKLRMTTQIKVIFPETSNDVTPLYEGEEPKVLYLLHGLSANCGEWTRFSKIEYYAKKYNMIVIMPEVQRSFYTSQITGMDYFGYVADELPKICQTWFRISDKRENTFIAGESMGGYGAVKIALNRPHQYAAAASLSGVLDYRSMVNAIIKNEWQDVSPEEIYIMHGASLTPETWEDPIALVEKLAQDENRPRLIQLCGTEDFLYEGNQRFKECAEKAGYGHTYLEGPGDHEWPYWDKAIQRAIQFFRNLDIENTILY
ncbi:MAG: esterase family protein [Dorea sp.]|nr:esterase family protein [Dorea sp.]